MFQNFGKWGNKFNHQKVSIRPSWPAENLLGSTPAHHNSHSAEGVASTWGAQSSDHAAHLYSSSFPPLWQSKQWDPQLFNSVLHRLVTQICWETCEFPAWKVVNSGDGERQFTAMRAGKKPREDLHFLTFFKNVFAHNLNQIVKTKQMSSC